MKMILIDTDVLLDFFFGRKPYADHTAVLLSLCETGKLTAYTSPVIISNMYFILRRRASHQLVIAKLRQLLNIIHILPIDSEIVQKTLNSEFSDFEDAIQYHTALAMKNINCLITRNIRDFKNSEIAVLTPFEFLESVNLA